LRNLDSMDEKSVQMLKEVYSFYSDRGGGKSDNPFSSTKSVSIKGTFIVNNIAEPPKYLLKKLIVPYFSNNEGKIKPPHHLIAWWKIIWSYVGPCEHDQVHLRKLCRIFRDSIPTPPLYTHYPHENYKTLQSLMCSMNKANNNNNKGAPKWLFLDRNYQAQQHRVQIEYEFQKINEQSDKCIIKLPDLLYDVSVFRTRNRSTTN
jgi:hypothetical protein